METVFELARERGTKRKKTKPLRVANVAADASASPEGPPPPPPSGGAAGDASARGRGRGKRVRGATSGRGRGRGKTAANQVDTKGGKVALAAIFMLFAAPTS